jgi:7,8-dihydropterin-6-yl-methyl-4-(beta-D-ribofuranosyl)aminobenzene 5'-phosphate synthase
MCDTDDRADVTAAEALPASLEWKGEVLPLEPVDELPVLTVCDNVMDMLLPDEGPAKRLPLAAMARLAPPLEAPAALRQGGRRATGPARVLRASGDPQGRPVRRLLFDTGITPGGCAGNLRRLGQDPAGIEAIVCSHGHFDHTTGLSGLIGQLGRANLPVLIHPEFWARRRLAIPGGEPFELPATSRSALEDAGFDVIEQRQPSFLYDRSVLITGEVDRVTGFEKGFPVHQAWRGQSWEPDPLIPDDQALIAHVAGRGLVVLTGCGHAGIINICRYAQRLTGVENLHAIIGGFHLTPPLFEPVIGGDKLCLPWCVVGAKWGAIGGRHQAIYSPLQSSISGIHQVSGHSGPRLPWCRPRSHREGQGSSLPNLTKITARWRRSCPSPRPRR